MRLRPGPFVASLVARAKDSQKRKEYMRDLRQARSKLGR